MSNDPDACVPQALTDFVFDLYDSVTLSQIPEEQSQLYDFAFRDLTQKYFASTPWPSPQSIASECNGDPLFLAIYRELTHRHWHSVSRPSVVDRMEGWDVYRELFDELLEDAEDSLRPSSSPPKFYILPDWSFDILHEFVYQFQGFCQFRTGVYNAARKMGVYLDGSNRNPDSGEPELVAPGGSNSNNKTQDLIDNVTTLAAHPDVWAADAVISYLHRLIAIGTSPKCTVPAYQYLGMFSSVVLSRLECLLSDYSGSLSAMAPLVEGGLTVATPLQSQPDTAIDVVNGVVSARVSLAYHAGISFLMMRRYLDAVNILSDVCLFLQRGFKTGQLRKLHGSDQLYKNFERTVALLAICVHVCPAAVIDESLARMIREKHGAQLSNAKEDVGEDDKKQFSSSSSSPSPFSELLGYCAPKFVTPAAPDFVLHPVASPEPGEDAGAPPPSSLPPMEYAYKTQLRLLEQDLNRQATFNKLRSYLKLYTSISSSKLESFGNDPVSLVALKLHLRQLASENPSMPSLENATYKSALDIHYHLDESSTVHVDEAQKQRRFENYFVAQIAQSVDIRKDARNIDTNV